ncbi:periplasmic protein, negative regulator of cpxR [Xenorhabdus vietnamensis]|uniref:Periplasmic protein, negative regulator of cpxR n=1 Tax=Xenorhabdus vietnamensis TaxID=351656 RepID=A0A1Y2SA49_9GAMM|nr:Spy/CpxP family protein refolding chaperone [Xenorhabdus vietnamensis]OTA14795.1 periplasmic protein, negative regulator of cpxR [Xenorhabdus vietnamensis]
MRNIAILALASMFVLGTTKALAETADADHVPEASSSSDCMQGDYKRSFSYYWGSQYNYSHILGGIVLTEQQRRQILSLAKDQHGYEQPLVDMRDARLKLDELLTTETFDEAEIRLLLEKIAENNVLLSIEILRFNNQVYQLLTPEQKTLLKKRYKTDKCITRKVD